MDQSTKKSLENKNLVTLDIRSGHMHYEMGMDKLLTSLQQSMPDVDPRRAAQDIVSSLGRIMSDLVPGLDINVLNVALAAGMSYELASHAVLTPGKVDIDIMIDQFAATFHSTLKELTPRNVKALEAAQKDGRLRMPSELKKK